MACRGGAVLGAWVSMTGVVLHTMPGHVWRKWGVVGGPGIDCWHGAPHHARVWGVGAKGGRGEWAVHARTVPFTRALPPGWADVAAHNGVAYTQYKKYLGPFEGPLACVRHPGGCGWAVAVWMWMWEQEHAGVTFHITDSDAAPASPAVC
ncbi:hypothetical protein K439DRAFT_1617225 [Ramaria rubella]|nr:hypothetical protein K439DRAFT_1617225 [Ramaria rubella]